MASHLHLLDDAIRVAPTGPRAATLSSKIVADVRAALGARRLAPGSFLGTENDVAAHWRVSRIVARDALRTLQALGVVEVKVGSGGGARIANSNPDLFADALGVQLDLMGVSAAEVLDAQRAIECLTAELAAENGTPEDHASLRDLLARSAASLDEPDAFTELSRRFHRAIARASRNRVLEIQLASLQHVSWPRRNRTLTPAVARHVLKVHTELTDLIEIRSAAEARRLMDEHVRMIGARRRAEQGSAAGARRTCC